MEGSSLSSTSTSYGYKVHQILCAKPKCFFQCIYFYHVTFGFCSISHITFQCLQVSLHMIHPLCRDWST
jgi:hypothetical protein